MSAKARQDDAATDLRAFGTVWPETTPTVGITPVLPEEIVLALARRASPSLERVPTDRGAAPEAEIPD